MDDDARPTLRWASAALGTAITLIAYYAIDRTRAGFFDPGPDPSTVIASGRSEYLWRVAICGYLTPLLLAGWYALARHREAVVWNRLQRLLLPTVIFAAALSIAFP